MHWLIVEDALRDRKGHWFEYVSTFVRGLRALGDEVELLCDRKAEGFILESLGARAVLPESIWHRMGDQAGAWKRYARVPLHAMATFFALRRVFRSFDHGGHNRTPGQARDGATEGRPEGRGSGNELVKEQSGVSHGGTANTEREAGQRLDKPSCAAFANPSTSELARECENTSLNRSASGPAYVLCTEKSGSRSAKVDQVSDSAEFLDAQAQAGLQMDSEKLSDIRKANDLRVSENNSESVSICAIRGQKSPKLNSTSCPPDIIFVPTVLVHHLLGWWLLLKTGSVPSNSRVLLFFPNLPIRLDEVGKPHWNGGPTTKLMSWLFASLRKEVESGRLVLGVETHAMQRALERLIGVRVIYLPHPVEVPAKARSREGKDLTTEDTESTEVQAGQCLDKPSCAVFSNPLPSELARECENTSLIRTSIGPAYSPATSYSLPATAAQPLVFGCYGAARWEKGSDIFQDAIKLILSNEVKREKWRVASGGNNTSSFISEPFTSYPLLVTADARPLHFSIQWIEDFADAEGNLVQLDPWLKNHPQVNVIDRYFEEGGYERQLEKTDVMVLPYRSPYRLRVSRVVIEAMICGMPVIATRGTTLFEQAEEYGVAIECEEGSAESLAEAILKVVEGFEMMRVRARDRATSAGESFSVKYFEDLLEKNRQNH